MKVIFLVLIFSARLAANCQAGNNPANRSNIPDAVLSFLSGYWKGSCTYEGKTRWVELEFDKPASGELLINWSIRETGIFRKPFSFWKWEAENDSLFLEGRFFRIKVDKSTPGSFEATISRHGFSANCRFQKDIRPVLPYQQRNITFKNDTVTLAGTLTIPPGKNKMPAIVFLHGSSYETRWDWAPYFADLYSRMGIVCLFYDKRGCGQSTGSWIGSSLEDLSDDAASAIGYLKSLDFVDQGNTGFWGFSQSGWVATKYLEKYPPPSFLIICSGGALTPREIEIFGYKNSLLQKGFGTAQVDSGLSLVNKYFDYLSYKMNLGEFKKEISKVRNSTWLTALGIERVIPSENNRKNWNWVADWDPMPSLAKIKFPLLLVYGEKDVQSDAVASIERWKKGLVNQRSEDLTVKTFKDANHGIRLGEHSAGAALFWQEFAPGYLDMVRSWAKKFIKPKL